MAGGQRNMPDRMVVGGLRLGGVGEEHRYLSANVTILETADGRGDQEIVVMDGHLHQRDRS